MKIEIELYPFTWIEIDPHDLYDDQLVSLAVHLEKNTIQLDSLDGTYWSTWDIARPPMPIRVVKS